MDLVENWGVRQLKRRQHRAGNELIPFTPPVASAARALWKQELYSLTDTQKENSKDNWILGSADSTNTTGEYTFHQQKQLHFHPANLFPLEQLRGCMMKQKSKQLSPHWWDFTGI